MEEKKNVFVYIRGVKNRGEEVIKTLEDLGGVDCYGCLGKDATRAYLINSMGEIVHTEMRDDSESWQWVRNHYTEIFLPKEEKTEYEFKPFQKVLVRWSSISPWQAELYSHYDKDGFIDAEDGSHNPIHICVGGCFNDCIPFEGNEYLLGITDNPKEE